MLITFRTPVYADITMFGDVAQTLLAMMGHSGSVPGALGAGDVPAALERLRAAVAANPNMPLNPHHEEDRDREQSVTLARRAMPLIQLLEAAAREGKHVMWDK